MKLILFLSGIFFITVTLYGDEAGELQKKLQLNETSMSRLVDGLDIFSKSLAEIQDNLWYAAKGLQSEFAQFKQKKQILIDKIDKLDQSNEKVKVLRESVRKTKMSETAPYSKELDKKLIMFENVTKGFSDYNEAVKHAKVQRLSKANDIKDLQEKAALVKRIANKWLEKSEVALTDKRNAWRADRLALAAKKQDELAQLLKNLAGKLKKIESDDAKVISEKNVVKVIMLGNDCIKLDTETESIDKSKNRTELDVAWRQFEDKVSVLVLRLATFEKEIQSFFDRVQDAKKVNIFSQRILGVLQEIHDAVIALDPTIDIDWKTPKPLEDAGLSPSDASEVIAIVAKAKAGTATKNDVNTFGATDLNAFFANVSEFLKI